MKLCSILKIDVYWFLGLSYNYTGQIITMKFC